MSYDWPGNVRELENVIERALIVNREGPLTFESFADISHARDSTGAHGKAGEFLPLDEVMKQHIQKGLERCNGQIEGPAGVARLLGIKPNTLRARMRKLGIEFGRRSSRNA